MLRVADLYTYLDTNVPYTYYINEFPSTAPDDSAYVRISAGFSPSEWTTKKRPSFQVLVRAINPQTAEQKAYEIYGHLHNKTEFTIGTTRIIHCSADQSAPMYVGKDENDRAIYSINFTVTTL